MVLIPIYVRKYLLLTYLVIHLNDITFSIKIVISNNKTYVLDPKGQSNSIFNSVFLALSTRFLFITSFWQRHQNVIQVISTEKGSPTTTPLPGPPLLAALSCYCVQRTVAKRAGFTLLSYRSKMDTVRKELKFHYWFLLFSFEITRPLRALSPPYGLSGNNNNHLQRVFLAISVFSFSRETKNTVLWQKRIIFWSSKWVPFRGNFDAITTNWER